MSGKWLKQNKLKKMTKKFNEIYVVAKNDYTLFNDCVYDKATAESVCAIAKESGHDGAEVITLEKCIESNYLF
jgi:hypothetical protein